MRFVEVLLVPGPPDRVPVYHTDDVEDRSMSQINQAALPSPYSGGKEAGGLDLK